MELRTPFSPVLSAKSIFVAGVGAAGVAFSVAVLGVLHRMHPAYQYLRPIDLMPIAGLSALLLAVLVARGGSMSSVIGRSVIGGAVLGFAATAAVCLHVTLSTGIPRGRLEDYAFGALAGLVF